MIEIVLNEIKGVVSDAERRISGAERSGSVPQWAQLNPEQNGWHHARSCQPSSTLTSAFRR